MVIEVDGPYHDWLDESERTAGLQALGFTVVRFSNDDVRYNLEGVFAVIEEMVRRLGPPPGSAGLPPSGGE